MKFNKINIFMTKDRNWLGIKITNSAVKQIYRLLWNNEKKNIKIFLKKSGCAGFRYVIEMFYKHDNVKYIIYMYKDINIYVLLKDAKILDGITIDYVKNGINKNFTFYNSKERHRCGCGDSFNLA